MCTNHKSPLVVTNILTDFLKYFERKEGRKKNHARVQFKENFTKQSSTLRKCYFSSGSNL